jgi:transposase
MQDTSFRLVKQGQGALPFIDYFLERIRLRSLLEESMGSSRYIDAILLLLKNVLVERNALYAIRQWSGQFDPVLVYGGAIGDDGMARALDKLFETDRASLMTRVVLEAVRQFSIDVSEIHEDTTSVKVFGAYANQKTKALQLKRGHSKDHRPDLKQLVYDLSVTRDGAIPVHFKAHDGNRTDDTLHWENWLSLRGMLGRSDFLYVADSKLCVKKTMMNIDRNHGRFITLVPRTRIEVAEFIDQCLASRIRWERVTVKRASRKHKRMDVFEVASGLFQLREGFRLFWFRSSEKRRRDVEDRETRIDQALDNLRGIDEPSRRRGPKTEASLRRKAEEILERFGAKQWVRLEIALERVEDFKQKTRGRAGEDTDYRRVVKWVPRLTAKRDLEAIAQSEVMDGIFPLTTNTDLKPIAVLDAYKYQPKLEKRHSLLKSGLKVAPVFLKKNDRIEALMFVYFLAQLVAALIEREIRVGMKKNNVEELLLLPEERPSKHPTAESLFRAFEHRTRHILKSHDGQPVQIFSEPLASVQQEALRLLGLKPSLYA